MKKFVLKSLLLVVTIVTSLSAMAGAKFKGYSKSAGGSTMNIREPLDRFEETKEYFLISVRGHSAFYKFPKKENHNSHVREFLNANLKSKKPITLDVDLTNSQILELGAP